MSNYAEQLTALMVRRNWKQGDVAKSINMSHGTVSAFLSGTYTGDIKGVTEKIINLINKENEKDGLTHVMTGFVLTDTAKQMMYVARTAHLDCDVSVIYGGAGLGKTSFLCHYASTYPDAILIEADPSFTARVLLEDLCRQLGLNVRGNMHILTDAIIERLRGSGSVLLIDEAELLPYRALEVIRRIHDKAGVGVVMVGLNRLITNLKGRRGEFLQLYSRVGFALNIGNELPVDDIHSIARQVINTDNGELLDAFYKSSGGNARRLSKLLRGAVRASETNKQPVSPALVRKFAEMLIH